MSQQQPPPKIPQITHTPSPKPPPSPTSSTCSSTPTEDFSDSGEELSSTVMEPSDYLLHGDLRSPGREFTRERSLRKKPPHRHPSSASVHSPPAPQTLQPEYPSDEEDAKGKNLTPEERSLARKKAKKQAKAVKRKALKSQETVKIPRKREDKRREDEIAAVEANLAALKTTDTPEQGHLDEAPSSPDRQRRRSSNTLQRPAKPRKTSSSNQGGGGGSGGGAALKSPKLGVDPEDIAGNKRNSPHFNAKHAAAFAQFNVEEGLHERSNDIDYHIASQAKLEAMGTVSRAGRIAAGLEEIEKRKRERKQNEALRGVVDAAQEKYEDEQLARLYGLK